jgi:hypothetical protein
MSEFHSHLMLKAIINTGHISFAQMHNRSKGFIES